MSFEAGSMLLGGMLDRRANRKEARKARKLARYQFDQQMDHSIARRVRDAERAGIHPLFALGASVGATPTMTAGMGARSNLAGAVGSAGRAMDVFLEKTRAETKKAEAEAAKENAEAAVLSSRLASSGRDGVRTYKYPISDDQEMELAYGPGFIEEPAFVTARGDQAGVEAGPARPSYVPYERADGSTGLAFGAGVPGAEEINALWIPLQNWWHTTKQARRRLREKLGITTSDYARMRNDPEHARAFLLRNKQRIERMKKEMRSFNQAVSGRPVR